jgi:hypothetical protein
MIEIGKLTEADKVREVCYRSRGLTEWGHITSWNERFIFVRYHAQKLDGNDHHVIPRIGTTSEATRPDDLTWAGELEG